MSATKPLMTGSEDDEAPRILHPQEIKAMVWMKGGTLTLVAQRAGLEESACRAALVRCVPKADQAIAKFLGVSLHDLWPDRYDDGGARISHVRDQTTGERDESHRLSAAGR